MKLGPAIFFGHGRQETVGGYGVDTSVAVGQALDNFMPNSGLIKQVDASAGNRIEQGAVLIVLE